MAGVQVAHPQDVVLVRLKPGKGDPLEAVHDGLFDVLANGLARRKRQHPGGVLVLERQGINQQAGVVRGAAQDLRRVRVTARPFLAGDVLDRTTPTAGAVPGEADNHQRPV